MKKIILLFTSLTFLQFVQADESQKWCEDFDQACGAAKLTMDSVIAYSGLKPSESYSCGTSNQADKLIVNYRPKWATHVDWYKLTYRKSDCKIENILLFKENI